MPSIVWFPSLRPNPENSSACNAPGPAPATTAPTTRSVASDASAGRQPPHADDRRRQPDAAAATTSQILTTLGGYADHESLAAVRPANPSTVLLRVYNSSSVRGQAKAVTDELRAAGFESILDGANDPLYPAADLRCVAQIRFGQAGAAAARTVLLVAPCAQLVVDCRVDDSVDLALGGRYIYDSVSRADPGRTEGDQRRGHPAGRDRGPDRGRQAAAADPAAAPGGLRDLTRPLAGRFVVARSAVPSAGHAAPSRPGVSTISARRPPKITERRVHQTARSSAWQHQQPETAFGIDIGGTGIKGGVVDLRGGVLIGERFRLDTPQPSTPQAVAETAGKVAANFDYQGPFGVAFPGVVLHGVVKTAANVDKGWIDTSLQNAMEPELPGPVTVLNDADAAGLAEARYGAGTRPARPGHRGHLRHRHRDRAGQRRQAGAERRARPHRAGRPRRGEPRRRHRPGSGTA